jgi:hypothetical protein
LNDVDELPSLKEFETLAREALGADDGLIIEEEVVMGEEPVEVIAEAGPQTGIETGIEAGIETGAEAVAVEGEAVAPTAETELQPQAGEPSVAEAEPARDAAQAARSGAD